jgi:hypothetical protein
MADAARGRSEVRAAATRGAFAIQWVAYGPTNLARVLTASLMDVPPAWEIQRGAAVVCTGHTLLAELPVLPKFHQGSAPR